MTSMQDNSSAAEILLEAIRISKAFPGVQALDGAGIVVRRGRLNALLGENGAGKSTLMNIIAGVMPPDAGDVLLEGQPRRLRTPRDAQIAGVSIIFQELNLAPNLTVAENIFLGREPRNRLGLIDVGRMNRDADRLLKQLELDVAPSAPVSRLKVGAQQMVEIAKALSFDAKVLILDEPTSALSEHETATLFRVIRQLKSQGVGMIYITHRLDELAEIADDVTIFRDGRLVAALPFDASRRDEFVRLMVGRDLSDLYPRSIAAPGAPVLEVTGLSLARPGQSGVFLVRNASLTVREGEVVGLFGLMGAGRTELLEAIFGVHPRETKGTVKVAGAARHIRSPLEAIRAGIVLAPEDRKQDGLVLPLSVVENIGLSSLSSLTRGGIVNDAKLRGIATSYVEHLRIRTPSLNEPVRNLSGGNQQKVVLAKGLAAKPKVLLLDEPTRGIDIGAKREIYALVDRWAREGMGILVASSELPELLAIADRILVMAEGRIAAEFSRDEATEERVLHAALPTSRTTEVTAA